MGLIRRLGRRRAVLAALGQAWVVQGAAILAGVWAPIALPSLVLMLPPWLLAAGWLIPGALGLGCALTRRCEPLGYGAVIFVPVAMAASWVLGSLTGVTGQTVSAGLSAGWTWTTVAVLTWITAGWREDSHGGRDG